MSQSIAVCMDLGARIIAAGGGLSAGPVDSAFSLKPSGHRAGRPERLASKGESGVCAFNDTAKLHQAVSIVLDHRKGPLQVEVDFHWNFRAR